MKGLPFLHSHSAGVDIAIFKKIKIFLLIVFADDSNNTDLGKQRSCQGKIIKEDLICRDLASYGRQNGIIWDTLENEIKLNFDNYFGGQMNSQESGTVTLLLQNMYKGYVETNFKIEILKPKPSELSERNQVKLKLSLNDNCNDQSFVLGYRHSMIIAQDIVYINPFKQIVFYLDSTKFYRIPNIEQKIIKSFYYLIEKGRWQSACLSGRSQVSINNNLTKKINRISIQDTVLTYDLERKMFSESKVLKIDSVFHENLVELYFDNDTITCTTDHPFFINNKGWSSLDPHKTMFNYTNYPKVKKLAIGDSFILKEGDKVSFSKLIGFTYKTSGEMTYTITKISNGNTYFVNGILTGVEHLKNKLTGQSK